MTASLPAPHLSPTAAMFNALLRLYIRRARPVIAAQLLALDEAKNLNAKLRTAADYKASLDAGYVDFAGLDA
jgi:hypothetical protein